jgi:hypothetical protein
VRCFDIPPLLRALCTFGPLAFANATELDPTRLPPAASAADFEKQIKPLLEGSCVRCHGEEKQKSDFRLDSREALLRGGENGQAIVERNSAQSPLVHYVSRIVEDLEMPPKKEEALTAEQVGWLRAWIDAGAPWPAGTRLTARNESSSAARETEKRRENHWAFKPPQRPPLPPVKAAEWVRTPVDQFIVSRLEHEGLHPSAEADRTTLLRRLSLDLIGFPPTVEEVDDFIQDTRPDAYTRQVERLLASPHYGERWARHWLDAARYADSDGYEKDKPRSVYFYRDWVVNALNRDLPYDRFIIEQLAGDLLPNPTQDQRVATGFLRNSMLNEEGGVDPEQFRMEAMFDRMDALGKSVLGLTIQCAQCHDHKFDPISQQEYYRLFAFLNNDDEAQPIVYTADDQKTRSSILEQIASRERALQETMPDWEERMAAWENELRARAKEPVSWHVIQPTVEDISTGGQRYLPLADGSFLAAGFQPTKHEVKMSVKTDLPEIAAFRIEVLRDANLPCSGPGRSHLGTFALTEFKVESVLPGQNRKTAALKFSEAMANLAPAADTPVHPNFNEKTPVHRVIGPASYAIDGKDDTAWSNDIGPGRRNRECAAVFVLEKPLVREGGGELVIRLSQKHGGWNADDLHGNNLGRFRISISAGSPNDWERIPAGVRQLLATPREERSGAQQQTIFRYWRGTVAAWDEANRAIEALWKEHPEGATQFVLQARENPRETHMLKRGDWLKPTRSVQPGVPSILNPLPQNAPRTRLTLARWLVDDRAPTTARVAVNRIWQTYFGTGLVSTPEDFGMQSERPSHPELLDWLACELMHPSCVPAGGASTAANSSGLPRWSLKHIHRLIVHSSVYRQRSMTTPELRERDPDNRLLARGVRLRVEGEIVRDIQLAASGLLNPALGGPAVMPPAPVFLFQPPASYAPFPWIEYTGPNRYRRALYPYRRRTTPYPLLQTFDVPEGNVSCVRRARSNTPLQALTTLNETLAMEAAQALARRTIENGGRTDHERIDYAFRRCLSRVPTDEERAELLRLLAKQTARIAEGWIDPWMLANGKNEKPANLPEGVSPAKLAGFTTLARVLLNLDETITKE